jgi:hypothetical protein
LEAPGSYFGDDNVEPWWGWSRRIERCLCLLSCQGSSYHHLELRNLTFDEGEPLKTKKEERLQIEKKDASENMDTKQEQEGVEMEEDLTLRVLCYQLLQRSVIDL